MPSSTSSSDFARAIPKLPWRGVTVIVVLLIFAVAAAWEVYVRSIGYGPTLNDTEDLWAQTRRKVQPESLVIVGDSRGWYDLDLDELEKGLGKRPIQLALPGSCAYPVLAELANDESFHGTVLCSFVPRMWLAPGGSLVENSEKALRRYRTQSLSQRTGHYLGMFLDEHVAFLKERDLTLEALLKRLPIPNRPGALAPPRTPPYFCSIDRERRARMIESCAQPGELQASIKRIWARNFTPPPPPSYIPKEIFLERMRSAREARFTDTTKAVEKLRARGGKAVFLRLPVSGELKAFEDRDTPRAQTWEPLLKMTRAAGIYFEDFPELSTFNCPEWSHLSAGDSVEFSKRLVPHLRTALQL
jgi:transposase